MGVNDFDSNLSTSFELPMSPDKVEKLRSQSQGMNHDGNEEDVNNLFNADRVNSVVKTQLYNHSFKLAQFTKPT